MVVRRRSLAILVSLAVVVGLGVYVAKRVVDGGLPLPRANRMCTVYETSQDRAGMKTRKIRLTSAQMANAATIAAVGMRRKLPERAIVVALATAFQESSMENLAGGDRDSVGLFQQRPSQGWGAVEQIRDPRYAANQFYAALEKVRGWEQMRVTDAAQTVQRSAFPEAYEKWADEAEVLTSALVGRTTGAVACSVAPEPAMRGSAAAATLAAELDLDWGRLPTKTPKELLGVALPVTDAQIGWRYAHWLVSQASRTGVKQVRFGNRQWTADDGRWLAKPGAASPDLVLAEVFPDI
ncbi:MAG TPA: hypothetical protein VFX61_18175 [Micromonosporaceae bacterium]|nr:hypothetical protein [Micromonosporaceae bacterium]